MVIPNWLAPYISAEEAQALEAQVADIESRCDVEIVPVIVRSSSQYPQTRITLSLIAIILFIELASLLDIQWSWDGRLQAVIFGVSFLVTLFAVVPLLSNWGRVQMLMTHRNVEEEQCWKRAQLEFYSGRVTQTKRENGILLFVSLLEHRVIVKADTAIEQKEKPVIWDNAVKAIVDGARQKKIAQGISQALKEMESLLVKDFPLVSLKVNELPNTIIIKE